MDQRKGRFFIITGPSGSGKTSIANSVLETMPGLARVITVTTRKKRPNEFDGEDYFFFKKEKFLRLVKKGAFIEWAEVYGNFYGTLKSEIEEKRKNFRAIISVLDAQGTMTFLKLIPDAIAIFVEPENIADLAERVKSRQTKTVDVCLRLMALKAEFAAKEFCHYILINRNDKIQGAIAEIKQIIFSYI